MRTSINKSIWPLGALLCLGAVAYSNYAANIVEERREVQLEEVDDSDYVDGAEFQKIEKYCDDISSVKDIVEAEKSKRFFALAGDKGSETWKEFATRSAWQMAVSKQDNQITAEVSLRSGKTAWVIIQSHSDVQWMKGEIELASRSLTSQYFFYSDGNLAKISSQWMNWRHWEGNKTESVYRKKIYNARGKQLISSTEYMDTDEGFSDKPSEETLPSLYRHVNKLPFYELLKKGRVKK